MAVSCRRREIGVRALFLILVFWLTITFASFGLFAPRNATVLAVLFVCALSVGSAVFLLLELDTPFDGVLRYRRSRCVTRLRISTSRTALCRFPSSRRGATSVSAPNAAGADPRFSIRIRERLPGCRLTAAGTTR